MTKKNRVVGATRAACVWALAASMSIANGARAAGIEDTVIGAEGLGRAAAFGRVNDFLAVSDNPANLVLVRPHVGGELRFPWLRACFDRARDPELLAENRYRSDPDTGLVLEHFNQVCNRAFSLPTGNIGWATSFGDWGLGVGLFTPAAVGNYAYGNDTIVTLDPQPDEPYTPTPAFNADGSPNLESPNRQIGLTRLGLTAFLMAGIGTRVTPWLRLGLSGGIGMVQVNNKSVVSTSGGTFQDQEVVSEVHATDYMVGRAVGSVVVTPLPGLEIFTVLQFHGDADARGELKLTANGIQGAPLKDCYQPEGSLPGSHCTVDDVKVRVPFTPIEATFGLRYALLRKGVSEKEEGGVPDPFEDEIFDLELNVAYARTSNVDQFEVTVHGGRTLDEFPTVQFGNTDRASELPVRNETVVPKNWRDTWTLRFGGDVNIVPGKFALRAGVSYATSAVPDGYMNIDFWPVQKIGAHAGFTIGITEKLHWHVGYAHLFYEDVTVPVGTGQVRDIATLDADLANATNEGSYAAVQDIFTSQLNFFY